MERRVWIAALLLLAGFVSPGWAQFRSETENFVVLGNDPQLNQKIAGLAEQFRSQLSREWLGYELPKWRQKCPIRYRLEMHARGETSFAFVPGTNSEPMDWDMQIFGPPDRLLDAVLPHEITHTIFATHFRQPLPRWADEGACTTVEHASERAKNHRMLMKYLRSKPSRGIPFNRMFLLREYPGDMLPLYAQGYSVAKYLIMHKGKQHFVKYIGAGLQSEARGRLPQAWDRVTREYYGFENLSELQIAWLEWVKAGSQPFDGTPAPAASAIASRTNAGVGEQNAMINGQSNFTIRQTFASNQTPSRTRSGPPSNRVESGPSPDSEVTTRQSAKPHQPSWYARQARLPRERMSQGPTTLR